MATALSTPQQKPNACANLIFNLPFVYVKLLSLIEVIKSTLYREHDLKHPIQEIIEKIATVKILQNGEKVTELNYRPILNKEEEGDIEIEFVPETD